LEGFLVNGKLDGDNTAYYADGTVLHRFKYKDGRKIGTNLEYHPNGEVKIREQILLGYDWSQDAYDSTGAKVYEKKFRKSDPLGTWLYFHTDGKTARVRESYEAGKLSGQRTTYFSNGSPEAEETYKYGMLMGPFRNYYGDGTLRSEGEFRSGRLHGAYKGFHENGKLKEEGQYIANKKSGEWKEYDKGGNWVRSYIFKAGILSEVKESKPNEGDQRN
jgi:antitoxin component YwqK of YwqJK toxin-antitoxin module